MPESTAVEVRELVERLFLISGTGAPQTVVFAVLQQTKEPNVLLCPRWSNPRPPSRRNLCAS
jgi:hypothetical protein